MFKKKKIKKTILIYSIALISYILLFTNSNSNDELWSHSNGNFKAHKFSNLNQINSLNVNKLRKAWTYRNGYVPNKGFNNQTTPIFTGSSIITTSLDGYLISLNPKNGKEKWRRKLIKPVGKRGLFFSKENNSIFAPTKKGVYAINKDTGEIQKNLGLKGVFGNSLSLLPPIKNKDTLFVAFTNKIESFDIQTGKSNWKFNLNGSRVWSGFSFDKKSKTIFIVTSNVINLWGNTDLKPNHSNSIILLNSNTGKIKCKFHDVKHDHWDFDMVGNPIVVDKDETVKSKLVYSFGKSGNVIVVNIEKCKLAYPNYVKKILTQKFKKNNFTSSKFDQIYSKTQNKFLKPEPLLDQRYNLDDFLKKQKDNENLEYVKFKARNSKYGEDFIPLSVDYDVIMKGLHGGPSWFGGTYDKNNKQIIIPSNHYPWILRSFYYDRLFNKLNKNYSAFEKKLVKNKRNYLSPWEKMEIKENSFQKFYSTLPRVLSNEGWKIYKNSCQSCHGLNKEGKFEGEITGDQYITSLIGLSFTNKFSSMNSLDSFKSAHKYSDADFSKLNKNDLEILKRYFSRHDYLLQKFDLLGIWGRWQLFLDKNKLPASNPPWGKISAINLLNGQINWSIPFGQRTINGKQVYGDINFGGIISTAGDISIATGTPDKFIRILNSKNGELLWKYELPVAGSSAPITYNFEGNQYIIVTASGGRFHGFEKKMGDFIIAFKLK